MNRTRTYTVTFDARRAQTITITDMTGDRLAQAVNDSVLIIERISTVDGARFVEESHSFPLRTVKSWTFTASPDDQEQAARAAEVEQYNLDAAEAARRENESPGGMYHGTRWASNS